MFENLRADMARYVREDEPLARRVQVFLESQGLWAVTVYRYGRWVYTSAPVRARPPLKLAYHVAQKLVEVTTGIKIPASCAIGPGLVVGHFGTIILHSDVRLGRNCSIAQDTTIGTRGLGGTGAPVAGDDVYFGAGCKVLGPIRIGDGAAIGANAVVLIDVPAGARAVGVPARIAQPRGVVTTLPARPPEAAGGADGAAAADGDAGAEDAGERQELAAGSERR